MNICIIGYCHKSDGFLGASNALEFFKYKVHLFPYLSYKMDKNENLIEAHNQEIAHQYNHAVAYAPRNPHHRRPDIDPAHCSDSEEMLANRSKVC